MNLESIQVILLDIEGTTSAIDFVHSTMFKYARDHLQEFLEATFEEQETTSAIQLLAINEEYNSLNHFLDGFLTRDEKITRVVTIATQRMLEDSKATGLKALQGMVWKKGFESRELKGHIYEDVPIAFKRWKSLNKIIAIYSSGSILAQKIYFANTTHGNLGQYICHYFDTTSGPKREPLSYQNITDALKLNASEILFLSDISEELDAAKAAKMQTGLVVRPGNKPSSNNVHYSFADFSNI